MHAWESVQKTLDFIEDNIANAIYVDELAKIAALSPFYFQRLFSRLVKKPVREYIKLRRLAFAAKKLELRQACMDITDIAMECGFANRETFSRSFKEVYGMWPSVYRDNPVGLDNFDKPNLLLNYVMIDEGVPLITEGIVLEYSRKMLDAPIDFLGVEDYWAFVPGKMLGERPGVSEPSAIWDKFNSISDTIPSIPHGRRVGVSYPGDAPKGYSTYFVGAEVTADTVCSADSHLTRWQMPSREYVVCHYEAENFEYLMQSMGKMMKFTRFWLKNHGLRAADFFPEIYYSNAQREHAYMEMWIPFNEREK